MFHIVGSDICGATIHRMHGCGKAFKTDYIVYCDYVSQKYKGDILINVQRDATICSLYFILLQIHSTCFGWRPHPSSGVHETVVIATGTGHMIVQLPHSDVAKLE